MFLNMPGIEHFGNRADAANEEEFRRRHDLARPPRVGSWQGPFAGIRAGESDIPEPGGEDLENAGESLAQCHTTRGELQMISSGQRDLEVCYSIWAVLIHP